MKKILIAALTFGAVAGAAVAGGPPAKNAKKPAVAAVNMVCPVMKSKVASVGKASGKSVYKGKTYYFCCGGCKPEFDKNPTKYVKAEPVKTKKAAPAKKKA